MIIVASVGYSLLHLTHFTAHHDHSDGDGMHSHDSRALKTFMGAMSLHCFADGMVVTASSELSATVSWTVFWLF